MNNQTQEPNPALAQSIVNSVSTLNKGASVIAGKGAKSVRANPALARNIVNRVTEESTGIRMRSGAASTPGVQRKMEAAQSKERTGESWETSRAAQNKQIRRAAIEKLKNSDIGTTARNLLHNPVMWASDTFGAAVDSAASGVASTAATLTGFGANVNEMTHTGDPEWQREKAAKMRNAANANAQSAAQYQQNAVDTLGGTKSGALLTKFGVAASQQYIDALTGSALGGALGLLRGSAAAGAYPTVSNMLGYTAPNTTGGSMTPMLVRSFGYGAQEAADEGFGEQGQVLGGLKSASLAYLTEKAFGGNPVYDVDAGFVNKLLGRVLNENSPIIKALASEPADIVYEGLEEVLEDLLDPLIDQGALWVSKDDRIQVNWPKAEELLEDFAIGSAMSAVTNLMSGNRETRELRQDLLSLDEGVDASIERLAQTTGDNSETLRNIIAPVWQNEQRLINSLATYYAGESGLTPADAAGVARRLATRFYSDLAQTQQQAQPARQTAQETAQQANQPTDAGIAPNAENAPSGVFNTAQDAQETKPTQTVADIYANRATRQANSNNDVAVTAGPSAYSGSNGLGSTLSSNIETLKGLSPVHTLTGNELNNRSQSLSDQIRGFFKSLGNKVTRPNFGDVELSEYGVASTINHLPINRARVLSVAAAPDVIANGQLIEYNENWKGRGYNSYIFAAPVKVGDNIVYVAAVVNQTDKNKFYLSEMVDSNGNYVRIERPRSTAQRAGVTVQDGVTAGPSGVSTDTHVSNDSVTQESRPVKPLTLEESIENFNRMSDEFGERLQQIQEESRTREIREDEVKWLEERGNWLNEEKQRIVGLQRQAQGLTSKNRGTAENHIDNRNWDAMRKPSIKSFQFDHPELHKYYAQMAEQLRDTVGFAMGGDRVVQTRKGRYINKSEVPSVIRGLVDSGATREEIMKACEAIINDEGQENYALAKRVEILLDDLLTNGSGFEQLYGKEGFARVEPNSEYIAKKAAIEGGSAEAELRARKDAEADEFVRMAEGDEWVDALEARQREAAPDGRDMDEGSLFDATKGPGAGATREGPQVPSQNNLTRDMSLSEEARQHIADSTPTHEQISDKLANARADAQIIRGPDGSWVNLQDCIDDLRAYVSEHGVLTPEQVKLAQNVARELDAQARESGDFSELRAFNNAVISATKTNSAQSLHAWREFSGSSVDVTTTALDILDNAPLRKGVDVNEVASRVSSYSDRAQQLFDADDISGLQALVTEISTERGYKPSRSIQKIINEQANAEQLYAMAQQLSVALAVDQIKPGIGQKLSTWQTLSHLLNSRTIIRNVVSNTLFSPVDRIANNVGIIPDFLFSMVRSAVSEKSIAQSRTVGHQPNIHSPFEGGKQLRQIRKDYIQQARLKNALDVNLDGERSKNPNKPDRVVNRTFKRKGTSGEGWVNKAWNRYNNIREGVLGYGLNVTDAWQKGKTKGQSEVAMKRLKENGSLISDAASERITNDDMLYRSFQRDTALGDLLGDLREFANRAGVGKRVGKGGKSHEYGLGSMLSAYTQVPGALVHTEADYTPLGVLNTAGELYNAIRYGNAPADGVVKGGRYDGMTNADASVVAQHNASVSLARAGIGGGIMALFGWLARAGIVAFQPYGGDDKDKDETNAAQGKGGLQFNQSAFVRALQGKDTTWQDGDIIHDLSQYPPLSTIAEIGVILADEENDDKFVSILTATAMGIAEQFGDLSMMNTVRTIYDDIQYAGDKNAVEIGADIAGDVAADSVSGLIPGTIRQIAKVSDGTMRDTSADTVQERVWNRFRSVMPGLRQTLPAKVDYKGEERQYAGNALTRGLNTFLLPGDVTIYQQDEVVDYIDKVAEETGKSLYAAAYAPKSFTVTDADGNEQTVTLDTDARRAYNEEYKSGYYAALEGLKSSDYADKLSYEQVAEIGRELRSLAADSAKRLYCEQNDIEYSSSYDKYQSIEDPALYLAMKETLKQLRSSNGADNEAFDAVYKQWKGLSQKEKEKYTEGVEGEFDGIDTLKKLNSCLNGGLSTEQFYKAKNKHDEINDDESLNASEKRAQFANWLDTKSRFTTAQKRTALSNFPYTTTLVADEGNYEKLTAAGVSKDGGMRLFNAMQELEPAEGYSDVANWQKCEAVTGSSLSDEEQLAALSVYATDSSYSYYQAAYDCGVSPSRWSDVLANIRGYEGQTKSNGKDTYSANVSQESLCRAMFDAGLSDAQAEAMYNEYRAARSWTKTYWDAMGDVNWSRLGYKTK